jgi:hypothetical protein
VLEKAEELAERERGGGEVGSVGGSLDRMAGNLAGRVDEERKGWWEWVWRKGRKSESGSGEGK